MPLLALGPWEPGSWASLLQFAAVGRALLRPRQRFSNSLTYFKLKCMFLFKYPVGNRKPDGRNLGSEPSRHHLPPKLLKLQLLVDGGGLLLVILFYAIVGVDPGLGCGIAVDFGKCNVLSFNHSTNLDIVGTDEFFCRFEYDSSTGAFNPDKVIVYDTISSVGNDAGGSPLFLGSAILLPIPAP
ncbi:hypothetical protein NE237_011926 [Protea cynaroides]|uniref:Uncharacterized protein n=1 Tax=Protea cynaroides TaxID=273540 RepID=A0A9Q0JYT6_9MAGN|nr:hypothetical protein NE237_011926 [Protea cynaroides]